MDDHLIVYGHQYCAEVFYLRSALDQKQIDYEWRDIAEGDPHWKEELRALARGYLSVPTIVFPDGQVLVEPDPREVLARLKQNA